MLSESSSWSVTHPHFVGLVVLINFVTFLNDKRIQVDVAAQG